MAFEVIPFCRIVKFSGITRFLYQFWKILPKYCGRKEKDHNILWSKWYSRRESNPQRPLRRGLLYPFNYGSVLNFIARGRNHCRKKFYTKIYTSFFPPRENKHKSSGFARKTCVLGNILWIEQYLRRGLLYPFNYGSISCYPAGNTSSLRSSCHRKRWGEPEMIFPASMQKHILLSRREYFVAALLVPPQAVGLSSEGGLLKFGNPWNVLYFTTFRAKRQLFSRGKFESAPAPPRSRFLSKNIIQTLDNEARICIIKVDMIQMVCSESAAAGREGI